MTHNPLIRLRGRAALRWVIDRMIGRAVLLLLVALLATVGFTTPSLAQEPVFSINSMLWEGEAAAANELDQDRNLLALDAALTLDEHSQLILPEPDADEVARRMAPGNSPVKDAVRQPLQTGFTRTVAGFAQLATSPAGTLRDSDGQDYAVSQRLVGSKGAVSIRLHFADVHLPAGTRLHVYGLADDGTLHNPQQRGYDNAWLGDRTSFWSHTVPGDSAVVEYHAPLDNGKTGRPASYTVDQVVHNVVDVSSANGATGADAASCNVDMCDNPAWRETGNGVVRLAFIKDGNVSASCSGALLNNQGKNGIPYIYTANHCISTQSVASTVEIEYFYQRNQCSDNPTDNTVTHLGTMLLTTGGEPAIVGGGSDHTLLRADTAPPEGVTFLGWTTGFIAARTPVTGIHHPLGDFKRISFGYKATYSSNQHGVIYADGIIESGSSGSPLIINGPDGNNPQVIGSSCCNNVQHSCGDPDIYTVYGKFSRAWPSFARYLKDSDQSDLIVDYVYALSTTPHPAAGFLIRARVRNAGAVATATTTLRYYRSDDSTITPDDSELATAVVGGLAVEGVSKEMVRVPMVDASRYWIGACVDPVSNETATDNNCSHGVRIAFDYPPSDLVVATVTVSDATPEPGVSFTINARAQNRGTGTAATATLRYYRSADDKISTTDTELTTDAFGRLAADATSEQSAAVSIADAGNYWVGACIDPVVGEVDKTNNCSTAVQVTVTAPPVVVPTLPDLTADGVRVSNASVEAGASFTINTTARNTGNGASPETTLRYYRSADDRISTTDTELTTDAVGGLAPGAILAQSAAVAITDAGEYWIGACIDPVADETARANCSAGVQITVTARADNNNDGSGSAFLLAIIQLLFGP